MPIEPRVITSEEFSRLVAPRAFLQFEQLLSAEASLPTATGGFWLMLARTVLQRFFERGSWPRYVLVEHDRVLGARLRFFGLPQEVYDQAPDAGQLAEIMRQACVWRGQRA